MGPLTERTPRVVSAVKLHRAAERRKTGLFLAEGENAVTEALRVGVVRELFFTERWLGSELDAGAAAVGVVPQVVTERAAAGLSDTVTPPGVVAVCRLLGVGLDRILADAPHLVVVPIEVGEPGNAGTIVRVADASGADGVIFAGDGVDPHNGKCVRASAGSLFHVPFARERSVKDVLAATRSAGLTVVATSADGEVDLDDADDLLATPTVWLFGSEAHGLPTEVLRSADHRLRIPIHGRAESLNLATAAAVCLYASARAQRRMGGGSEGAGSSKKRVVRPTGDR